MISELSIRNFAIIDDISITFRDGLTVLTGETGAGKSIIIDAVQLLAGTRASVDYVRHGAEKAEITGLFTVDPSHRELNQACDTHDIDQEEGTIILERVITNQGKSVCRVNGKIVTLAVLREFGSALVTIHSQHDTVQLMDRKNHLPLLDVYDAAALATAKKKYDTAYAAYASLRQQHLTLSRNEQELAQRIDLLQFQWSELTEAGLEEKEDEYLADERQQLQNYEKIHQALQEAYFALYGEGKGLEWVDVAQNSLQQTKELDPLIASLSEPLTNLYYNLEDISFKLRDHGEQLHFDENRLNDIEARLNELNRLKKKYGATVEEMLSYQDEVKQELDTLTHKDVHLEKLTEEMAVAKNKVIDAAKALHKKRKQIAASLETEIQQELKDLYLENARFSVDFVPIDEREPDVNGLDSITFMLATNLGEPLKPLSKTASGGELSRIMLVLKKMFAKHDQIPTVIFDEIDTGVSGRVAQAIAEKMYQIAASTQVLCITHLAQVAAMADQHLLIHKEETKTRTSTMIDTLTEKQQINELGKMITGTTLTTTAIEHAEELLALTGSFKVELEKTS